MLTENVGRVIRSTWRRNAAAVALTAACMVPGLAPAQWTEDIAVNTPVATGVMPQPLHVAKDGSGGYYIAFLHDLDPEQFRYRWQLFVQRIDSGGNRLWGASGIALTTPEEAVYHDVHEERPQIISDGEGNAIVSWWLETGEQQASLTAQKLGPDGAGLWPGDGVVVVQDGNPYIYASPMVTDGAGGAIIAWTDYSQFDEASVLAQRVSASGEILWPSVSPGQPDGMLVGAGDDVDMIPAPGNGAMLTFTHFLNGVFAQRLGGAGEALWGAGGKVLGKSFRSVITSDSDGGAIIGWAQANPTVQKLSLDGTEAWPAGGVALPAVAGNLLIFGYDIISDGAGGVYFLHHTTDIPRERLGINRLLADGTVAWPAPVEFFARDNNIDILPQIVSDGANGAIVSYSVREPGYTSLNVFRNIQAQRFGPDGSLMYGPEGIPVTTAEGSLFIHRLVPADIGAAVAFWGENRPNAPGVYAQKVPAVPPPSGDALPDLWSVVSPDKKFGGLQVKASCKETRKGMKCKLNATFLVLNSGTADAAKFTSTAYLSRDGILSADDVRIKDLKVKKVLAEMSKTVKVKVKGTLPSGYSGAGNYLLFQVDSNGEIPESVEGNNLTVVGPLPVN